MLRRARQLALCALVAALCVFHVAVAQGEAALVRTPAALRWAIQKRTPHIIIQEHLDLSEERTVIIPDEAAGAPPSGRPPELPSVLAVPPQTQSIRVCLARVCAHAAARR